MEMPSEIEFVERPFLVHFTYRDQSGLDLHTEFTVWCFALPRVGDWVESPSGLRVVRRVVHRFRRHPVPADVAASSDLIQVPHVVLVDLPGGNQDG